MAGGTETVEGSAGVQGDLWGERARDWADVLEGWNGWGVPLYRHVLERVPVGSGTILLDVGCGAGRFCRVAADRGAQVAGIDAAGALVEIARERIQNADFRVGDMEALPWDDDSFDVVTGFNSFFIAADLVNALREARRVARPGASMAMTVFGRPERCGVDPGFRVAATVRALAIERGETNGARAPRGSSGAGGDSGRIHPDRGRLHPGSGGVPRSGHDAAWLHGGRTVCAGGALGGRGGGPRGAVPRCSPLRSPAGVTGSRTRSAT